MPAPSMAQAFTPEKTDELYTPRILVECLTNPFQEWYFKFLTRRLTDLGYSHVTEYQKDHGEDLSLLKPTIWAPFDTEDSEFVHYFKDVWNLPVVYSHIWTGQDFFKYEPETWDIAISNPPFSKKLDVFKRLDSFNKPWAMVMNTMALNYMEVGEYFVDGQIQLLIPNKRISFNGSPSSFNSGFVCRSFLPRDLVFCRVKNCNSKKDFVPSRMYKWHGEPMLKAPDLKCPKCGGLVETWVKKTYTSHYQAFCENKGCDFHIPYWVRKNSQAHLTQEEVVDAAPGHAIKPISMKRKDDER